MVDAVIRIARADREPLRQLKAEDGPEDKLGIGSGCARISAVWARSIRRTAAAPKVRVGAQKKATLS